MAKHHPGPDQVHFTLLENGLDFVWSAVEHLSVATSKRGLKYALLHLVSGIELILKEWLRREDWKLVFPKPEKADEVLYKTGAFKSIDFGQLIDRVEGYCFDGNWALDLRYQALLRRGCRRCRGRHHVGRPGTRRSSPRTAIWLLGAPLGSTPARRWPGVTPGWETRGAKLPRTEQHSRARRKSLAQAPPRH